MVADSSEGSDLTESKFACDANDVPTKIETRGRKKKYQNDTDRLNARKEQQKKYRDRQKEKIKELLLLVEGLDADDIVDCRGIPLPARGLKASARFGFPLPNRPSR